MRCPFSKALQGLKGVNGVATAKEQTNAAGLMHAISRAYAKYLPPQNPPVNELPTAVTVLV